MVKKNRLGKFVCSTLSVLAIFTGVLVVANTSQAQVGSRVPRAEYYLAKEAFYAGEYRDAQRGFSRALKSGVRIGQQRWIDSICHYTMVGEVQFHQGNLAAALEAYEMAIKVHLLNTGWMSRLVYPRIGPSTDRIQTKIGWGRRTTVMGEFSDSMSSLEGSLDLTTPFQIGGVVNPAHTRRVDGVEVIRCLAVALRRRAELLGDTGRLSPSTAAITDSLSSVTTPSGHWVTSWVEVLYGLALLSDGQYKEASGHLSTGAAAGNFDHPLTGIALLEQGKYRLKIGEYERAVGLLHQASLAAARYRQADVVEESFRYMTDAFLANEGRGAFPAIGTAVAYAQSERLARLAASLRLNSAEIAVYSNDPSSAGGLLNQARTIMARRGLLGTDLGGRLSYLDALTQYRAGNTKAAATAMKLALGYMQRGSIRRFHLTMIEALHAAGRKAISPRNAEILYSRMLREPTSNDWRTNPMETITMLLSQHTGAIERWFELLIDQKDYDKAVKVAEHLRRHRFYSTLPFGGRILSLRWLVEGEVAMLGTEGMKQKKHLRDKYPALAKLSRRAEKIRLKLKADPLLPKDEEHLKEQKELYGELVNVSSQLENLTREIALRREPAKLVFPPQPSLSAIKKGMEPHQAILMFVTTAQGWHAWFIRHNQDEYWRIQNPKIVRRDIASLLKLIGNRERNSVIAADALDSDEWKQPAARLWKKLIGEFPSNGWDGLEELVIVPDGVLWYLPFELLQIPADQLEGVNEDAMLLSRSRVRYAPVASLSVGDQKDHPGKLRTTMIGGQLFPRESNEYASEMLKRLKTEVTDLEVIGKTKKPIKPSQYTAGQLERLIVWNDINVSRSAPYGWSPAQYDQGTNNNSRLSDWIEYPWGAPDQIIAPGFHTAAEGTLNAKATGHEVFLAACGLMASGTRTALLSRWRTGGKVPAVLTREFTVALSTSSASEAWRTATELARIEKLDPKIEPRLRTAKDITEVSADHPFFWAGYLLIDTGSEPKEEPNHAPAVPKADEQDEDEPENVDADAKDDQAKIDNDAKLVEGEGKEEAEVKQVKQVKQVEQAADVAVPQEPAP